MKAKTEKLKKENQIKNVEILTRKLDYLDQYWLDEQNSPEYIKEQYERQIEKQNSPSYIAKQYKEQCERQKKRGF